jgi:hypothetical protein
MEDPTAENITKDIFNLVQPCLLSNIRLVSVAIKETDTSEAIYLGD